MIEFLAGTHLTLRHLQQQLRLLCHTHAWLLTVLLQAQVLDDVGDAAVLVLHLVIGRMIMIMTVMTVTAVVRMMMMMMIIMMLVIDGCYLLLIMTGHNLTSWHLVGKW